MSGPTDSPAEHDGVFDSGLQPERTLLAWRRTCLAFGVASLVGARFMVPQLGLLAVVGGILGAGLAVLAYALAATGYRRAHEALRSGGTLTRSGLPILCAAGAVLVIGALCAASLVLDVLA